MSKSTRNDCQIIQELLIKKEIDLITDVEKSQLNNHLENCEECTRYQENINQLSAGMKVDESSLLEPRKSTRHILLSRLIQKNKKPHLRFRDMLDKIKSLLRYRIPVYQAMLATVLIALFVLILSQSFITQIGPDKQTFLSAGYDSVDVNIPDMRIHLNFIEEEKMGRNLKEDSILARYISRSL